MKNQTDRQTDNLINAGWRLSKAWVCKTSPHKLTISGTGNLKTIESVFDLYDLNKITDSEYSIRFHKQFFYSG